MRWGIFLLTALFGTLALVISMRVRKHWEHCFQPFVFGGNLKRREKITRITSELKVMVMCCLTPGQNHVQVFKSLLKVGI